jgi:hypothetical protein
MAVKSPGEIGNGLVVLGIRRRQHLSFPQHSYFRAKLYFKAPCESFLNDVPHFLKRHDIARPLATKI